MNRVYEINLDFKNTDTIMTNIAFKQYDYGTSFISLALTFNHEPADLGNDTVVAVFKSAKGKIILDDNNRPSRAFGYVTKAAEGRVAILIPKEVLDYPGKCLCEIVSFAEGSIRRTTQSFAFQIVSSITELDPIEPPPGFEAIVGRFLCGQTTVGYGVEDVARADTLGYTPTLWINGITPVNASNMNKIEDELQRLALELNSLSSMQISYETEADLNVKTVKDALDKLLYVPLSANFTTSTTVFQKGVTISNILFNWSYNKNIQWQKFNNEIIEISLRSKAYTAGFNQNKTFTLSASDGSSTINRNIGVSFLNGRYWGVSSSQIYDSSLILSLSKELNESRAKTFTVNCGAGQYIYYCIPSRLGLPSFTVGGFTGGFSKVSTLNFQNSSGYSEGYDIWKSTNSNLGNTTVVVG